MPEIVSAEFTEWGGIIVVYEGQKPDTVVWVPVDPGNKEYMELQEWVAKGNEIRAYVAPPPPPPQPTVEDLMARITELEKRLSNGL